jgi:ATP-dependent RNA helicase RhlE
MNNFKKLNLSKHLVNAVDDLGFKEPTPIQKEVYSIILSGKDVVGIAQTGTGKTLAYMLPILHDLKFSKQVNPRVLILVPTRELVLQMVEKIESYSTYINVRVVGVFGGVNINAQRQAIAQGCDIVVATPGRLYDLALNRSLQLKSIKKLVIDEVDVMLDLGFRHQLINIFELLPVKRQNLMFSATMTEDVDLLIKDFFTTPTKVSIAVSGTPLENIKQSCYKVSNFNTKINLLEYLINDKEEFSKVVVFVANKKSADRLFEALENTFGSEVAVIHSNKAQNYRIRSIEEFDNGIKRILVATDVISRGIDMDKVTHVINFDTPTFPENYMHRIGRTGRAEQEGKTILFYTNKEVAAKESIETLMAFKIPGIKFPEEVEISLELIPEEMPKDAQSNFNRNDKKTDRGAGFHEKKEKNKKTNQGGSYKREIKKKYKKPKTKGDKNFNRRNKKK